ncbi:unnamed protein product [Psylliodes chrysocephalus]|uniref:Uncharacterized protein n=1 Tax=Psylliodes chrysocephalus TaxID=3402493 RepID=A0A9P0CWF5_9CUCU|nr:unnamed protein product [Psylliodes chrysocephala]
MKKKKIGTFYKLIKKLGGFLKTAKDRRDPPTSAGVYRIPYICGKVYIGQKKETHWYTTNRTQTKLSFRTNRKVCSHRTHYPMENTISFSKTPTWRLYKYTNMKRTSTEWKKNNIT